MHHFHTLLLVPNSVLFALTFFLSLFLLTLLPFLYSPRPPLPTLPPSPLSLYPLLCSFLPRSIHLPCLVLFKGSGIEAENIYNENDRDILFPALEVCCVRRSLSCYTVTASPLIFYKYLPIGLFHNTAVSASTRLLSVFRGKGSLARAACLMKCAFDI